VVTGMEMTLASTSGMLERLWEKEMDLDQGTPERMRKVVQRGRGRKAKPRFQILEC
jgi:hypothetical protein